MSEPYNLPLKGEDYSSRIFLIETIPRICSVLCFTWDPAALEIQGLDNRYELLIPNLIYKY